MLFEELRQFLVLFIAVDDLYRVSKTDRRLFLGRCRDIDLGGWFPVSASAISSDAGSERSLTASLSNFDIGGLKSSMAPGMNVTLDANYLPSKKVRHDELLKRLELERAEIPEVFDD